MIRAIAAAVVLLVASSARAHQLDEYVQAAQLSLAPEAVAIELRLIPGVHLADPVLARIDRDGDGVLSSAEQSAYAQAVVGDLSLEIDGQPAALHLDASHFPSIDEIRGGVGTIRLRLTAAASLTSAGRHQVTFHNAHLPELGSYLVNLITPAPAFEIRSQQRDRLQRSFRVDFAVRSNPLPVAPAALALGSIGLALLGFTLQRRWPVGRSIRPRAI